MSVEHGRGRGVRFNYSLQYSEARNVTANTLAREEALLGRTLGLYFFLVFSVILIAFSVKLFQDYTKLCLAAYVVSSC